MAKFGCLQLRNSIICINATWFCSNYDNNWLKHFIGNSYKLIKEIEPHKKTEKAYTYLGISLDHRTS